MTTYLQAAAGVLLAVILSLTMGKRSGEMSMVLVIGVCCMVLILAAGYLQPVISFIRTLQSVGQLDTDLVAVLLKVVGISMISQIASLICTDGGSASMGKALQMLSAAVILYLSLPVLQALLELVEEILGSV